MDVEKSFFIFKVNCVKVRYLRRVEVIKVDGSNLLSDEKKDINFNDVNFIVYVGMLN